MTAKLLIAAVLMLPLANSIEAQSASTLKADKLVGNVRSVRTEQTWTTENVESKRVLMTVETYDNRGNKTEWDAYKGSDKPLRSLFTYDDKGNVIEQMWYDSADQPKGKTTYTYDSNGLLIQEESSNGIKILYGYDSHGNKTSQRIFDVAKDEGPRVFGPVEKTVRYSYDRKNHLTEISSYNPNGSRVWNPALQAHRIIYTYDKQGRIRHQTVFNQNNTIRTATSYLYDSLGRIGNELMFTSKDRTTWAYRYSYRVDSTGNWIVQTKLKLVPAKGRRLYIPVETVYRSFDYY
jgi:YD repeat-containing protein